MCYMCYHSGMGTVSENRSGIEGTLNTLVGGPDTANWAVNVYQSGAISVTISDSAGGVHVSGDRDQINRFAAALIAAARHSGRRQADG